MALDEGRLEHKRIARVAKNIGLQITHFKHK